MKKDIPWWRIAVLFCLAMLSILPAHCQNECPSGSYVPPWGTYTTSNGVTHQTMCWTSDGKLNLPFTGNIGGNSGGVKYASCSTLQSDINTACNGTIPGSIMLPLGSCALTATLLPPSNCMISGYGINLSTLTTGNFDGINNSNGASGNSNIILKEFTLDASGQSSGSGRGVYFQNVNLYYLDRIRVFNPLITGFIAESGSTKGWIEDSIFDTTRGGSCVELGNGPIASASVVFDTHINRNSIYDCNKDGIFVLGSSSVGQYGSGPFEISNNIIKRALDTGIEFGVSADTGSVKGNTVILNPSASTGITARSSRGVTESDNVVIGTGTAGQTGYQVWNQSGDNTIVQNVNMSGNVAYNLPIGYKTTAPAASIDNVSLNGNVCLSCTTTVSNSGNETNYRQCNNSDDICASTNQITFDTGRITAGTTTTMPQFQSIQGGRTGIKFRENQIALPNGLWRWQSSGDIFQFNKNTAAGGDFSASVNALQFAAGTTPTPQFPIGLQSQTISTTTNCSVNSASPAACGSAASGAFVVPTTTTSYTVNTSAVTSTSRITITPRTFTGDLPGTPTCVTPATTSTYNISGASAGTSFTITLPSTTGQTCWNFVIID